MTEIPLVLASRIRMHSGSIHGKRIVDIIGPPIRQSPENASALTGTGAQRSIANSCQDLVMIEECGKIARSISVSVKRNMATGFMVSASVASERAGNSTLVLLACLWFAAPVVEVDVGLAGLFPGKALLTINGGAPRIVPVGVKTDEGVKVLSIDGGTATLEVDGKSVFWVSVKM